MDCCLLVADQSPIAHLQNLEEVLAADREFISVVGIHLDVVDTDLLEQTEADTLFTLPSMDFDRGYFHVPS